MPKPTRRAMNECRLRFRGFAVLGMLVLAAASFATKGRAAGVPGQQYVAEHLSGVLIPFIVNAGQPSTVIGSSRGRSSKATQRRSSNGYSAPSSSKASV